uniref:CSON009512 protein n=1 Tax=Culicoides sonorensis TaxID=179676 RepID=A0A336KG01_CULSO
MASQQYQVQSKVVGLLTTVNSLPPSYKSHYTASTKTSSSSANNHFYTDHSYSELVTAAPLDLSKKPIFQPVVPLITPPSTPSPLKKRYRDYEDESENNQAKKLFKASCQVTLTNLITDENKPITVKKEGEKTPNKPIKSVSAQKSSKNPPPYPKETKRTKVSRKLKFDEWQSSPVSGTIIRPLEEITGNTDHQSGDIDPEYNIVEATDEARAEIATIPNVIGDYKCKLCRIDFEDVFELARHRCSCIVLLEYRCPECGKKFNCPANLASHRRWHKPRDQVKKSENTSDENQFPCTECNKSFKRMAYLKKHQATHNKNPKNSKNNNNNSENTKSSESTQRNRLISMQSSDISDSYSKDSNYSTTSSVNTNNNNNYASYSSSKSDTASQGHQEPQKIMSDIVFNFTKSQHDDDDESSCSSEDSTRLQIISDRFTEDENIAAAALAHLRHGSSVIKHTSLQAV